VYFGIGARVRRKRVVIHREPPTALGLTACIKPGSDRLNSVVEILKMFRTPPLTKKLGDFSSISVFSVNPFAALPARLIFPAEEINNNPQTAG